MYIVFSILFLTFCIGYPIYMIVNAIDRHRKGQKIGKHLAIEVGIGAIVFVCLGVWLSATAPEDSSSESSKPRTHKVEKKATKAKKAVKKQTTKAKPKPKKSKPKAAPKPKKKAPNKPSKPKKKVKAHFSKAEKEAAALTLLQHIFKGKAKVWFDAKDKAFMVQPTGDDIKEALLEVKAGEGKAEWHELTHSFDSMSRSLYKNLGLADFVSLVNPEYKDKVLYSSLDGKGVYDFTEDN